MTAAPTTRVKGNEPPTQVKGNEPTTRLKGSKEAKRQGAVLLEVLTGLCTPTEASETLGCSVPRVYQLEARALQGIVDALEPRSRGRKLSPERKLEELEREKTQVEQELVRTQSLLRAAYRSFGMPASRATGKKESKPTGTKGRKKRKRQVRARKAVARLKAEGHEEAAAVQASAG